MICFDVKKQNVRRNQILRILHFGRSSKPHCMEQCGTYLTSTVIPQYVTHLHQKGMIQMKSIVWNLCV